MVLLDFLVSSSVPALKHAEQSEGLGMFDPGPLFVFL